MPKHVGSSDSNIFWPTLKGHAFDLNICTNVLTIIAYFGFWEQLVDWVSIYWKISYLYVWYCVRFNFAGSIWNLKMTLNLICVQFANLVVIIIFGYPDSFCIALTKLKMCCSVNINTSRLSKNRFSPNNKSLQRRQMLRHVLNTVLIFLSHSQAPQKTAEDFVSCSHFFLNFDTPLLISQTIFFLCMMASSRSLSLPIVHAVKLLLHVKVSKRKKTWGK